VDAEPAGVEDALNCSSGSEAAFGALIYKRKAGEFRIEVLRLEAHAPKLARRMLADRRYRHLSIAQLALECGFGDISYFNRSFRRRYGETPSDVREMSRRGDESRA
jgi:AraC-like DNA-binding protein